jgi:hypothetical protein
MTNDMWYGDNIAAGYSPADYKAAPIAALTQGFAMPKNQPRRWLDEGPMLENSWTALQPAVHEILSQRPPSQYIPTQKLDIDPEDIMVDEGNSTRKATPKELWEAYGFFKCQKEGCPDECKAAGLVLEEEEMERLVQANGGSLGLSYCCCRLSAISVIPIHNCSTWKGDFCATDNDHFSRANPYRCILYNDNNNKRFDIIPSIYLQPFQQRD